MLLLFLRSVNFTKGLAYGAKDPGFLSALQLLSLSPLGFTSSALFSSLTPSYSGNDLMYTTNVFVSFLWSRQVIMGHVHSYFISCRYTTGHAAAYNIDSYFVFGGISTVSKTTGARPLYNTIKNWFMRYALYAFSLASSSKKNCRE